MIFCSVEHRGDIVEHFPNFRSTLLNAFSEKAVADANVNTTLIIKAQKNKSAEIIEKAQ